MRILIVGNYVPNPDSGASGTEVQTVEALRRLGHEVECVWADSLPHRITHANLHMLLEMPHGMRRAIASRVRSKSFDVIHVSQPHCWLAARDHHVQRRGGVFVQRSHGWEVRVHEALLPWRRKWSVPEKTFPGSITTSVVRTLLQRHNTLAVAHCDGTVVSSTLCRDFILRRHRAAPERVAVIPQAAPDAFLREPCPPASVVRQLRILYVGQFQFVKAPRVVAEVFRRLAACRTDVRFTWVCDRTHHRAVRELLGSVASRCDIIEWKNQSDLRTLYDSHGLFVFPSLFEGFGKAFLEAMSRGMCVVASDEGGMHDVLHHDINGYLVPVGEVDAIVSLAEAIMCDLSRFQRICRAAGETATQFSWDRVAAELVTFYDRLLQLKLQRSTARGGEEVSAGVRSGGW